MNIKTDNEGKISREVYLKVKKRINAERGYKINAIRLLKGNRQLTKHMPPSAYSHAINGIKGAIRELDQQLVEWKQEFVRSNQPQLFQNVEDILLDAAKVLEAAEHYVRHYAIKQGDGHAAGVLNMIKSIGDRAKKIFDNK